MKGADFRWARMEGADLSYARMEDVEFYKATMEGVILNFASAKGTDFSYAHMEGADFRGAQINEANLSYVQMEGALVTRYADNVRVLPALSQTPLESRFLVAAKTKWVAVKDIKLTGAYFLPSQIRQTFGDASTILPQYIPRPCHWSDQKLTTGVKFWSGVPFDTDPFIGRWRGWVEANGGTWPTSPRFNNFKDVTAIPPPSRCPLVAEILFEAEHGLTP